MERGDEASARCLDPMWDISAAPEVRVLRPCIIRWGEDSLEEATADGARDALEGADICGGTDSTSRDATNGGPGTDVGDPENMGGAETRGGVEALVRDIDAAALDAERGDDTHLGGGLLAGSLTGEVISGCKAAG